MVLDLNKVKINESIEDGALSVIEQIPGLVMYADQTPKLRLGEFRLYFYYYFCLWSQLSFYLFKIEQLITE